jgi:hypothetical protein
MQILFFLNNTFRYDKYLPSEELKSYDMSLYKMSSEMIAYIIKKQNIDKKILNEMKEKFFMDKDIGFIKDYPIDFFNYIFTFNNVKI